MPTNMIVDLSNIAHVARHSVGKQDEVTVGLIIHKVITSLFYAYQQYKPDGILIACDSRNVWRKDFYPDYKAQRDAERDEYYELTREAIDELQEFFNTCTSIPALSVARAEADDVIATVKRATHDLRSDIKTVIISSDKDFVQLLDDRTVLFSPPQKKERESDNVAFDLFVKCIRGDTGDNIFSAYPRVRTTLLEKAWKDPLEMANLMESTNNRGEKVGDVYDRNKTLIDLSQIPQYIQDSILDAFSELMDSGNKYSFITASKFLAKYELRKISEDIHVFKRIFKSRYVI